MDRGRTSDDIELRLGLLDDAARGVEAESKILEAFEDDLLRVRQHAIVLAVRHIEPDRLGRLVADDVNAKLRNCALEALERQGLYAVDCLSAMSRGENSEVAMFAVQTLAKICAPGSAQILVAALDHEDERVSLSAIGALGDLAVSSAVPRLCSMISGTAWQQFAVLRALGQIGDPSAIPTILSAIREPMLAEAVVDALSQIATVECLAPLCDVLDRPDAPALPRKALRGISKILESEQPVEIESYLDQPGSSIACFLTESLRSEDVDLARAAGRVVMACGRESIYRDLLLRAVDAEECQWLGALLTEYALPIERALPQLLEDRESRVRLNVVELGTFGAGAWPLLITMLDDEDEDMRAAAARALGRGRAVCAVPALFARLRAAGDDERPAVVEALSRMPVQALAPLRDELDPANDVSRLCAALQIVGVAECSAFAEEVSSLLGDVRSEVRKAATRAATGLTLDEAELVRMLRDPDPAVAIAAVEACIEHARHDGVPVLRELLARSAPTRYWVIRALGRLQASSAATDLRSLFEEAESYERVEIVASLIRIAPDWIVPFLKQRLLSDDGELRRLGVTGLIGIPDALDLKELLALTRDEDWSIRSYAAWALGGHSTEEAGAALFSLVRDIEPVVARTARGALERSRDL